MSNMDGCQVRSLGDAVIESPHHRVIVCDQSTPEAWMRRWISARLTTASPSAAQLCPSATALAVPAKATPGPRTAMLAPPRGRCRVLRRVFGASLWPPGTRPPQDVERPGIGEGAVSWARGSESWWDRRRAGARRGTPPPRSCGCDPARPVWTSGPVGLGSGK